MGCLRTAHADEVRGFFQQRTAEQVENARDGMRLFRLGGAANPEKAALLDSGLKRRFPPI